MTGSMSRTFALLTVAVVVIAGVVGVMVFNARAVPDSHGVAAAPSQAGRVLHFRLHARSVHRTLRETLLVSSAPGPSNDGLIVFLHADHGTEDSTLSPQLRAAWAGLGARAPAMVFLGGGQRSYWQDRPGEAWGRYVMRDVLPAALRMTGADPRRVVIAGISMGAYGALDLARLHPGRFCAVAAHSPVLWRHWRGVERDQPGAFVDRADFARHDLLGLAHDRPRAFAGTRLWLDAGRSDGLARPGVLSFAAELRRGGVDVHARTGWPGGHNGRYWGAHWAAYLRFDAAALMHCG